MPPPDLVPAALPSPWTQGHQHLQQGGRCSMPHISPAWMLRGADPQVMALRAAEEREE